MKEKKLLQGLSPFLFFLFSAAVSPAQMVGTDAFLKGNSVEIGLSGAGGFEGSNNAISPPLPGMHPRSNTGLFGFVANPQLNSWSGSDFDGDFFTPGSPENGWGFEIDTTGGPSGSNNCAGPVIIPGAITSWNYSAPLISCDWEGDVTTATNLHFKINYALQDPDLFYITTISITNNTSSPINDLYYYRNLDPDNNQELSGDYTTNNTILSQIMSAGVDTRVSATSSLPWSSYFEFIAVDPNWVAGYGGFANRDASDLYNGIGFTQAVGVSNFADEAIYLAYHIPVLAPAATETFKFATVFDPASVTAASAALSASSLSTDELSGSSAVNIYPNPLTESSTITIDKSLALRNASLHIFDMLGKQVRVSEIENHSFRLEKSDLAPGMYMYRLENNGGTAASGKLLIR